MARTAEISKEKRQSIITLRHVGQSIWNISRTLKVYTSAVAKTIKCYDETGSHVDRYRKRRPRVISSAEDKFIRVNCTRLQPKYMLHRVQLTETEEEETFLGQETRAMDIRQAVLSCPLV